VKVAEGRMRGGSRRSKATDIALRQLTDTLDDIRLLAGSEAYDAARAFYKYVKVVAAENLPGAKAVHAALRERFPYTRRRAASESAD
jgi:hypothetical protein